jgi:EmrB/QacA subfamily drug resistance transporter
VSGARIGRRGAAAVLVAVSLAQITTVLDYYALTVALPEMARDFGVRATDLHWVLSGYLLGFASLLVLGGRLADRYGRRRVLIIGVSTFGVASALCGLAPWIPALVAFRVVQGIGAALVVPASMAALVEAFPRERRGWAVGVVVGVTSVGTAVGPFVGGALAGTFGWRSVFLINVPVMIAAIVMCLLALEESRDPDARGALDWTGAALLAAALLAVIIAIDRAREWPLPSVALTAACAVGFLCAFWSVERRVPVPILDRALLRRPGLARAVGAGCLDNYGWAACVFAVTLFLQVVRGLSPVATGAAFLALSAGTAVGGPLAGRLARRFSIPPTMALGLVLSAAGIGWLALLPTNAVFFAALALTGVGVGLAYSTAIFATAEAAPGGQAGAAQGVTMTALIMCAAIAVTTCGMLIEELSPTGRATADAIEGVLLVGALVTAAGLLVLAVRLPSLVRERGLGGRPVQDIGSARKT